MTEYPEAKIGEARYAEWDAEFEMWAVFGEDSGHCYGQYNFEKDAEEAAQLND